MSEGQARLYLRLRLLAPAERAVRRLLAVSPEAPQARLLAGQILFEKGSYAAARRQAAAALRLRPWDPAALQLAAELDLRFGDGEAALSRARAALAANPDDAPTLCAAATASMLSGRLAEAAELAARAARRQPGFARAPLLAGEIALRSGRHEEALSLVERALGLGGDCLSARIIRTLCLIANSSEAWRSDWTRVAQELRPLGAGVPAREAAVREFLLREILPQMKGSRSFPETRVVPGARGGPRLERFSRPVRNFRLELRQALVRAQALLRESDARSAFAAFELVMRETRDPVGRALALAHRGEVFLWLGRWSAAEADFKRALRLFPRTRWAPVGLCAVATLRGRYSAALALADRALANGAESVLVWKGEALRRSGDAAAAIPALERALTLQPQRLGALINLALARRGDAALFARCESLAPKLFEDARGGGRREVLERALSLLRGNRSSWMDVYFTPSGTMRFWRGASVV